MLKSIRRNTFSKLTFLLASVLLLGLVSLAQADARPLRPDQPLPASIAEARLDTAVTVDNINSLIKVDSSLVDVEGAQRVIVRLSEPPIAALATNGNLSHQAQLDQLSRINAQQEALIATVTQLDSNAQVLGTTSRVLNSVMLEVDAAVIGELADRVAVVSINGIQDYEIALSETVPYIGATAVQNAGYDGSGIRVAVLDSGIDYLHAAFGGSGNPADYAANDPSIIEPGTFPTAKVVGGYDFVGSNWPNTSEEPDPDPLDDGPAAGHGTHVGHIIGGVGGVAPGVDLYAVKVCSSVSTSCSGVALIQGMEFAVDPNMDGFVDDAVDIINMSLGANYGTAFDDDLSQAVEAASQIGVLTVAAAGNGSDKPFIAGTPANAPSALSVAQTNVPSAFLPLMEVTAPENITGLYEAVFQAWSVQPTAPIEAPLLYGDGAGGNLDGCAPFTTDLSGYIVLVDRGNCNFTLKISNISQAGGEAGIIGLVASGEPFSGGDGGDRPIDIPGYMISQADANTLKSGLPDTVVRFDPNTGIPLIMHMVGSSSRGPAFGSHIIKPEIGAPGASVSAIAGTGTVEGPFGGTSGASPMVAGSAALIRQAYPDRSPTEVKSVLMNTAETDIINEAVIGGVGQLAPITRIGGGEVRVDRALASPAAAWDSDSPSGALSFGFHDVYRRFKVLHRRVTVRNYSDENILYKVTPTFRYQDDADTNAVDVYAPRFVHVPANGTAQFRVVVRIKARNLRPWTLNSGSNGNNPAPLTELEYDGYFWLDNVFSNEDDDNPLHIAAQVLPRRASDVNVRSHVVEIDGEFAGIPAGQTTLRNSGEITGTVNSYSLVGGSLNQPEGGPGEQNPMPDLKYFGYATFPVPAGFCSADESFVMEFAISTWEPQTHAVAPTRFLVLLDVDQDGTADYNVFNFDLSSPFQVFPSDGRNVTWVADLNAGTASAFFFTGHDINSKNTVLTICGEQIGMNATNFFDPMDVEVLANDWYYAGAFTDSISGITISPLGEQYLGVFENGGTGFTDIPAHDSDLLHVLDFGPLTNEPEFGLLLLYRNGDRVEADHVLVAPVELP